MIIATRKILKNRYWEMLAVIKGMIARGEELTYENCSEASGMTRSNAGRWLKRLREEGRVPERRNRRPPEAKRPYFNPCGKGPPAPDIDYRIHWYSQRSDGKPLFDGSPFNHRDDRE
jgi:hypothetical protein